MEKQSIFQQAFEGRPGDARASGRLGRMLEHREAMTMWFSLEDVDKDCGCVCDVRGSHLRGMRDHNRTKSLGFSQGISDYGRAKDLQNGIAIPVRPGDLLDHHSLTILCADSNPSAVRTRKALGLICYCAEARENAPAHAAHQNNSPLKCKSPKNF